MKTTKLGLSAFLLALTVGALHAQRNDEAPEVTERGANYNLVRVARGVAEAGTGPAYLPPPREKESFTSYTELASGLNYLNEGEWTPSVAVFENFEEGIVARQGQTKVILNHSLNHPLGSVDMLASDGGRMRSSVFGIAYFDRLTGQSVMIAGRKESRAVLVPPNQVVYLDAFEGDVVADLRYTYRIGGFEQDVILRENPPSPLEYGLNPETTVLEVWTEFAEAPVPREELRVIKETEEDIRDLYVEPDLIDSRLDFGAIQMVQGKAFALTDGQGEPQEERSREVLTAKRWQDLGEDGLFLIEAVDYLDVAEDLSVLPEAQASVDREASEGRQEMMAAIQQGPLRRIASVNVPEWGEALTAVVGPSETLMASAADFTQRPGYVLDYVTINANQSNYTFQGGNTYYISAPYTLSGTTTFEGGAVIKYDTSDYITISGSISFETELHNPVIFTSKNDNTVGETISGSSGLPAMGNYAAAIKLSSSGSYNIENARFRYATNAIETSGGWLWLWNSQVVSCEYAMRGTVNYNQFYFLNVLVTDSDHLVYGGSNTQWLYGLNLTADGLDTLAVNLSYYWGFYNSLITNIGTDPTAGLDDDVANFIDTGSASDIYQTVGAGEFYLKDQSSHRNLADALEYAELDVYLDRSTTYPPALLTGSATSDLALSPTPIRDSDGLRDGGYHYPAMDYELREFWVEGPDLTVHPGTALITITNVPLVINNDSQVALEGTAEDPVIFVSHNLVQEKAVNYIGSSGTLINAYNNSNSPADLSFNFTKAYFHSTLGYTLYAYAGTFEIDTLTVKNSEFYGGKFLLSGGTGNIFTVENTLFENPGYVSFDDEPEVSMKNSLVYQGPLYLFNGGSSSDWQFYYNVFDNVEIDELFTSSLNNYNGYVGSSPDILLGTGGNDTSVSSFTYTSDTFGPYYHYLTTFENDGNVTASSRGLTHFGTDDDNTKDTGNVDLGYHYVAADAYDEAFDTDGDGIPDYLEDLNGDNDSAGSPDAGETDWLKSENGTSDTGGELQVFTMLE